MHPNRVVAVIAALLSLALAVLPVLGDFDWTSTAGVLAGIAAVVAVVDRWLRGWQAHENRQVPASAWKPGGGGAEGLKQWQTAMRDAQSEELEADPELDDPEYPDAPAVPTLQQHSNLQ